MPDVVKGRLYRNSHEIIVSQNLIDLGYHLNQKVKLGSQTKAYKIVGITRATKFSEVPVIYLNLNAFTQLKYGAQRFTKAADKPISMVVVKNRAADKVTVKNNGDGTKLDKMSVNTFIQNIPGYSAQNITLDTMIGFLFVVVTAIVGIFLYVMTLQKNGSIWCLEGARRSDPLFSIVDYWSIPNCWCDRGWTGLHLRVSD